jgi:hypothetical protein
MKRLHPHHRPLGAAVLCALVLATPAMARMPDPTHLPRCHSTIEADATCRLPVKNHAFDSLDAWTKLGDVSQKSEGGNAYASLGYGSAIQQPVYAHFYKWNGAAYALRFRVRSDAGEAHVHAAMYMSDDQGRKTVPIGSTTVTAREGMWRVVDLVANGKPYPAPAHVLVEITNVENAESAGDNASVHVDDVYLVESADAEAVDVDAIR